MHVIDQCLSGPELSDSSGGPSGHASPAPLLAEFTPPHCPAIGNDEPTTLATDAGDAQPVQEFIDYFKKPLPRPVLSTPILRATRLRAREDADLVPKQSARLAAKSRCREPKPEAQAHKVMMRRLGFDEFQETVLPGEASFDEFQEVFTLPLSPSKREAMEILFPARKQRTPAAA
jgi:hypothetical protein